MNTPNVEAIELDIRQARSLVDAEDALNRLYANKDFQAVILDGYFKEEAWRLVELKAAPAMQHEGHQRMISQAIDAIGGLQQHFNKIRVMADEARAAIEYSEQELELMAAEGEV